jgi:chromosome segregation ATPase
MNQERTNIFLERQLKLASERENALLEQVKALLFQNANLSGQLNLFAVQIDELNQTVKSHKAELMKKTSDLSSLSGKNRGLAKLLHNTSEKVTPVETDFPPNEPEKKPYNPKERGNNACTSCIAQVAQSEKYTLPWKRRLWIFGLMIPNLTGKRQEN